MATINAIKAKYDTILNLGFPDDIAEKIKQRDAEYKIAGMEKVTVEYQKQAKEYFSNYGK